MDRRTFLGMLASSGAAIPLAGARCTGSEGSTLHSEEPARALHELEPRPRVYRRRVTRRIPSSGMEIPVIGMGTWITFNVGRDEEARARRAEVVRAFFEAGGGMIDSSPMYGSSEEVVGHCLRAIGASPQLFSATKVWTPSPSRGRRQVETSLKLWGVRRFDLLQVHNLVSWEAHLEMLFAMKEEGRVGHVGITTSHGRRHDAMEKIMQSQPLDFVQLTYNAADREADRRLLPLAAERGIAVIANRPFRGGPLVDRYRGERLPEWAGEIGCRNWPQFLLKYVVSHPAITCAIPATTRVDHMQENMGAAHGPMPDAAMRTRMLRHLAEL